MTAWQDAPKHPHYNYNSRAVCERVVEGDLCLLCRVLTELVPTDTVGGSKYMHRALESRNNYKDARENGCKYFVNPPNIHLRPFNDTQSEVGF